jgi:hypothetical protein
MPVEQDLKDMILEKYKSVRAFSEITGIPYSTIDSIFKRGIGNSSVSNVLRICKELGIDADALGDGAIRKRNPSPDAAAAHFDSTKLTPEGRAQYENFIHYLTDNYMKK